MVARAPAADPGVSAWPATAAAAGSFCAGLLCALALADVVHPDVVFPKYLAAAAATPAERAERLLDYSPLYLGMVQALLPFGLASILAVQALLHAATAAAAALAAGLLAGRRGWAWLAGLGVASYRPFLTYCGMHEPETAILFCLALALLFGLLARARLAAGAGPQAAAAPAAASPPAAASLCSRATPPDGLAGSSGPVAGRRGSLATAVLVTLAFACLAAAALGRPQHLLLVPAWALWLTSAAPPSGRRAARRLVWWAALLVSAAILGPPVVERARVTGVPTIMNPGAVFYEGNGPGATGLTRYAPPAVIQLERAHRESADYGHVAYRRIASAAAGRKLAPAAANRYWTALAWEAMTARPAAAARRFGRKALLSLAPYEGHDLLIAERLDRRLRRWLPWGFAVPLLALAWVPMARRRRLAELGGPLALAVLACAVQVAVYASARQRLPVALALWIVLPALGSDLAARRLGVAVRPLLAVLLGIGVALALAAATARVAVLDQLGWDRLLGRRPATLGDALCGIQDGRALRPRLRRLAEGFAAGAALTAQGRPADSLRVLAPLLGGGIDLTSDDRQIGVPEYWAALDLLALGARPQAAAMAQAARAVRPQDARISALALRLARPRDPRLQAAVVAGIGGWRPPGCDPVSRRLVLAAAAAADGDRPAALAMLRPLAADFPELVR